LFWNFKARTASIIIETGANGLIIGSAMVNIIKKNLGDFEKMENKMVEFFSSIKKAIRRSK
jgi:tryptophan synthase alpha subunit